MTVGLLGLTSPVWEGVPVGLHRAMLALMVATFLICGALAAAGRRVLRDADLGLQRALAQQQELREGLERRVQERTDALMQEMEVRTAAEERLRHAQKIEAVGQLTGGIAHDFNNALTVITSTLEMLRDDDVEPAESLDLLEGALAAVQSSSNLTGQLLAFARKQPLVPHAFDLVEMVQRSVGLLRRTLGASIVIRFEPSEPVLTWADESQVESALVNLAVNARDAMPGGGELVIETSVQASLVELRVRDSGIGMAPEVRDRIFEPFFTTKASGRGTGLGLSMVYGFVTQSGGEIDVSSIEGEGTEIVIRLPRAAAPEASEAVPAEGSSAVRASRILLLEDDDAVRSVARRILEHGGHTVVDVRTGADALSELANQSFDLLFSDIVLPGGMDGVDVAKRVRELSPDIQVLLASGYAASAALEGAAFDFLRKPYGAPQLLDAVQDTLGPPHEAELVS
ncbi:MAG: ATP-binding protein [Myxococcota bacterium]